MNQPDPIATATQSWLGAVPDWVSALANECAATSQNKVAKRLGRSATVVSNVLRAKYTGDMAAIEDIVRSVLMPDVIPCPGVGQIASADCLDWRRKSEVFIGTNPQRIRMFRACNRCPRNLKTQKEDTNV